MALIYCPDCGKQVSERAVACPNCGCPIRSIIQPLLDDEGESCLEGNTTPVSLSTESPSDKDLRVDIDERYRYDVFGVRL